MKDKKEVYCKNCKHVRWLMSAMSFQRICRLEKTRNFFGNKIGVPCIEKNQDLDCKDYEKKWYKPN